MPSDFGERRAARAPGTVAGAHPPPPQAEHLPCPRCDSTNTKFCYYNNYNLSQPRHFCKACRRYWTQGGTLRNIPVGGGTRKSAKRSRPSTSTTSSASSSAMHDHSMNMISSSPANNPISVLSSGGVKSEMHPCDVNLNDSVSGPGSFTSLLGSQGPAGFLALGGYGVGGLGPATGFDDMGPYGFGGRGIWAFPEVANVPVNGAGGGGGGHGAAASGCNAWQLNGVDNGLVDADCFAWPELAISMPGQGLK